MSVNSAANEIINITNYTYDQQHSLQSSKSEK